MPELIFFNSMKEDEDITGLQGFGVLDQKHRGGHCRLCF
jgi:hypothetical protein